MLRTWLSHPGRNPLHSPEGRQRHNFKHPATGTVMRQLGSRNPSRWLPHQGKRECARRLARAAAC